MPDLPQDGNVVCLERIRPLSTTDTPVAPEISQIGVGKNQGRLSFVITSQTLGAWVGEWLRKHRVSEKDVARDADCPLTTAATIRAGNMCPGSPTLLRLFIAYPRMFVDCKREILGFHSPDDPAFEAAMMEAISAHRKALSTAIGAASIASDAIEHPKE